MHPFCLSEAQGLNTSQEFPTTIPVGQRGHRRGDWSSKVNVPYTASYLYIGGTYVTARLHCCPEGPGRNIPEMLQAVKAKPSTHLWEASHMDSATSISGGKRCVCLTRCRKHYSVWRVMSARKKTCNFSESHKPLPQPTRVLSDYIKASSIRSAPV